MLNAKRGSDGNDPEAKPSRTDKPPFKALIYVSLVILILAAAAFAIFKIVSAPTNPEQTPDNDSDMAMMASLPESGQVAGNNGETAEYADVPGISGVQDSSLTEKDSIEEDFTEEDFNNDFNDIYVTTLSAGYDYIYDYYDGYAIVQVGDWENGKYGVIDMTGREIVPPVYDKINHCQDGYVSASLGKRCGAFDINGKEIIPFEYENIYFRCEDNIAVVNVGGWQGTTGLVELSTGRVVVPLGIYNGVDTVGEGLGYAYTGFSDVNYKWGLISLKTGELVFPLTYSWIYNFFEGLAIACKAEWPGSEMVTKYGFIDTSGNEVIPFIYDQNSGPFNGGQAKVSYEGKWGVINAKGEYIIEPKYDNLWAWQDFATQTDVDYLAVSVDDHAFYGIVDKNGLEVIPPVYSNVTVINNKLALVDEGNWENPAAGILEIETGRYVVPAKYSAIQPLDDDYAIVYTGVWGNDNYKAGIIDIMANTVIVDFIYGDMWQPSDNVVAARIGGHWVDSDWSGKMLTGGKWGAIDKTGREIIPFEYNGIRDYAPGIKKVFVGEEPVYYWSAFVGKWGLVDYDGNIILPLEYDYIGSPRGDYALVNNGGEWIPGDGDSNTITNGRWGVIGKDGEVVIPAVLEYGQMYFITETVLMAEQNGMWKLIALK